jgi:hypothetical protein
MAMNTPFSEFAGGINSTVDAYRANPAPLQQEVRQNSKKPLVDQSLIKLIAASMLNEEQKAKEQEINRALNPPVNTVADQTINQLTRNKEMEIARRVGMVNQQKAQERRRRMDAMGIGGLPTSMNQRTMPQQRPTMQAAGGGIVAFQPGGDVVADDTSLVDVGLDKAQGILDFAIENPFSTIAGAIGSVALFRNKLAKAAGRGAIKLSKSVVDAFEKAAGLPGKKRTGPSGMPTTTTSLGEKVIDDAGRSAARKKIGGASLGAGVLSESVDLALEGEGEEGEETGTDTTGVTTGVNTGVTTGAEEEKDAGIPTTPDFDALIQDALTRRTTDMNALGIASVDPDLSVSAIQKRGDDAVEAARTRQDKLIENLRTGRIELGEQIDEGISKRDDVLKQMQDRADMLAGRGDYQQAARVKEFLNSLATVGGGRNLGEGLARGFGASMAQEDVRRLRGAEADKEIAAFQAETADKLVQNAKEMFGLDSEIALKAEEYLSNIDRMNADTAAKMLQAQALETEVQKLGLSLQQSNIEAGFKADLQKIQAAVDLFKVAATRDINLRQQDVELLINYNSGITELVTAINSQLTNEEDKKKLLAELTKIQGIVDTLTKSLNLTK